MQAEQSNTPEQVPGRGKKVRSFLAADKVPMWFTALALLFGAGGTYLIAPLVNAEFEAQKIRTDFVISNYHDLRAKLEEFQGLYVLATQRQAAGDSVQADVLRMQELIARTSAQMVAMMPLFGDAKGPRASGEVTAAMTGMVQVLFANAGATVATDEEVTAYNQQVNEALQVLIPPLLTLYVELGSVGRLRPTATDTDLK